MEDKCEGSLTTVRAARDPRTIPHCFGRTTAPSHLRCNTWTCSSVAPKLHSRPLIPRRPFLDLIGREQFGHALHGAGDVRLGNEAGGDVPVGLREAKRRDAPVL